MNPQTLTAEETAMLKLLRAHPALAEKVAEVLAVVAGGSAGAETIDAAESRLVAPVRELGLHALGGWAQRAEQAAGERLQVDDPGAKVRVKKKTAWHCGYGRLEVTERVWQGHVGAWQRPFAALVGLSARGCSLRLQRLASDLALEEPFGRAAARLLEHHGVTLGPSTLRALTLRHAGALAARQLARPPVRTLPATGASAVVVEADGTLLPHVEFAAGPGDRRKLRQVAFREVRLLVAQAAGQTFAHYAVSLGDLEEAAGQWQHAARQAGWAAPTYVHPVGDGAEWIAARARTAFGTPARYLLDLYHVGDYLAAAAPAADPDYLTRQKSALCHGQAAAVIAELAARREPAATPAADAPVRAAHRYLSNRSDQLDYPAALARDLPIGSGLIESGHKHVLQKRLKIPGAAWLRPNCAAIAHARAVRANGGWPAYWDDLALARN